MFFCQIGSASNSSATIAAEVPVWFWDKKMNVGISGHIRNRKLFILDYKAQAEKEEYAVSQLYLYACGLSLRTKLPLSAFVCAYFDEKQYIEFAPEQRICPKF